MEYRSCSNRSMPHLSEMMVAVEKSAKQFNQPPQSLHKPLMHNQFCQLASILLLVVHHLGRFKQDPVMIKKLFSAAMLASAVAAHAAPVVVLPTAPFDGLGPQQFDEGTIYSAKMLDDMRTAGLIPAGTGPFDAAQGSGQLGIIVYSSNGVANPTGWEAPMDALNSGPFDGTWGLTKTGTLGLLRSLLGGAQPLFVFDHNENAKNDGGILYISGEVSIRRGNSVLASFSLDTVANGTYDQTSRVLSCGDADVGPAAPMPYGDCSIPAPTTSGTTYHWTTSGSGKPDYFALFGGLDIYSGLFQDGDSVVVQMSLTNNDSGFEELSIAGYRFYQVPEPASVALVGLGLVAAGGVRRRRRAA